MGVVDFRRPVPNWRRYLPPIHFFAPILKKRKNFPTISGEAINRRTGSEHLLPRVTRSSLGRLTFENTRSKNFIDLSTHFVIDRVYDPELSIETKRKRKKKRRKEKEDETRVTKAPFFLFILLYLLETNTKDRKNERKVEEESGGR